MTVTGYADGSRETYEVTMAESERSTTASSALESTSYRGYMTVTSVSRLLRGRVPRFIGGSPDAPTSVSEFSIAQRIFSTVSLRFIGVAGGFGYNFAGFTGIATNFYTVRARSGRSERRR